MHNLFRLNVHFTFNEMIVIGMIQDIQINTKILFNKYIFNVKYDFSTDFENLVSMLLFCFFLQFYS